MRFYSINKMKRLNLALKVGTIMNKSKWKIPFKFIGKGFNESHLPFIPLFVVQSRSITSRSLSLEWQSRSCFVCMDWVSSWPYPNIRKGLPCCQGQTRLRTFVNYALRKLITGPLFLLVSGELDKKASKCPSGPHFEHLTIINEQMS